GARSFFAAAPQTGAGDAGTKVSLSGSKVTVNKGAQRGLRQRADLLRVCLAALEKDQRRNPADAELVGDLRIRVDVELRDGEPARVLLGHGFEHRCDHLARAAPFRPVIDENGRV